MKKNTTFDIVPFDEEERQFMEDYEAGKYIPVENQKEKIKEAVQAAQNTLRVLKNKNINIRVSSGDLTKLKDKAANSGLPYQTLISILLHKYVEDEIKIIL